MALLVSHCSSVILAPVILLPVSAERSEREHRHPDRGELDDGDEFARRLSEHPLLGEVAEGVHGHAGDQQQQVSRRQAGDEDVGHAPHGAVRDEDLHQRDVAQQTHDDDQNIHGGHHAAHHEVYGLRAVRGRPRAGYLRGVGAQSLRGKVREELVIHECARRSTPRQDRPLLRKGKLARKAAETAGVCVTVLGCVGVGGSTPAPTTRETEKFSNSCSSEKLLKAERKLTRVKRGEAPLSLPPPLSHPQSGGESLR